MDNVKNVRSDVVLPKEAEAVSRIWEYVKSAAADEVWEVVREDLRVAYGYRYEETLGSKVC